MIKLPSASSLHPSLLDPRRDGREGSEERREGGEGREEGREEGSEEREVGGLRKERKERKVRAQREVRKEEATSSLEVFKEVQVREHSLLRQMLEPKRKKNLIFDRF